MAIYQRYILHQILRPLATALLIALIVLLLERMLQLLDLVLGSSGPIKVVFEILAFLVPHYLGVALPVSLFLGIVLAFSRLYRDGELEALHSAGINLGHMLKPAIATALGLMLVEAVLVSYLQPYGRYAYQSMVYSLNNASFQAFLRAGVFTQIEGVSFLVEEIRPDGLSFGRIFILDEKSSGKVDVIAARSGRLGYDAVDDAPLLRLFDGVRMTIGENAALETERKPPPLAVLRFQELRTSLGPKAEQLFRPRGKDEREFTLWELWERRDTPPPGVRSSDMIAELHGRLVHIAAIPILPFLAIPLALGRRRSERTHGIAVGLLILLAFNQILDLGENITETGAISPWLGLWLPYAVFVAASLTLFYRAGFQIPAASQSAPVEKLIRALTSLVPRPAPPPEKPQ